MNKFTTISLSIVAIVIFLFAAYKFTNTPTDTVNPEVSKVSKSDHVKWARDSKHVLVEYSDLQCPACQSFAQFMRTEIEASGSANADIMKKVKFAYRHFPLVQHEQAEEAAWSAEAAGKQGKFFEFVDLAFTNQAEWAEKKDALKKFESYAQSLKLDMSKFRKDRDSKEVKDKVAGDLQSGVQTAVNSTPTFYLNGQKLGPINSFEDFLEPLKALK